MNTLARVLNAWQLLHRYHSSLLPLKFCNRSKGLCGEEKQEHANFHMLACYVFIYHDALSL